MTTPIERPWTDTSKSPKDRIALLMAEMTLEENMSSHYFHLPGKIKKSLL
jgi:hypothetical protein